MPSFNPLANVTLNPSFWKYIYIFCNFFSAAIRDMVVHFNFSSFFSVLLSWLKGCHISHICHLRHKVSRIFIRRLSKPRALDWRPSLNSRSLRAFLKLRFDQIGWPLCPHHSMNCSIYNVWFIEFHPFLFKLKDEYPNTSCNDCS